MEAFIICVIVLLIHVNRGSRDAWKAMICYFYKACSIRSKIEFLWLSITFVWRHINMYYVYVLNKND